jgi:hypothetical protein
MTEVMEYLIRLLSAESQPAKAVLADMYGCIFIRSFSDKIVAMLYL